MHASTQAGMVVGKVNSHPGQITSLYFYLLKHITVPLPPQRFCFSFRRVAAAAEISLIFLVSCCFSRITNCLYCLARCSGIALQRFSLFSFSAAAAAAAVAAAAASAASAATL
jgi:hypothetical protein